MVKDNNQRFRLLIRIFKFWKKLRDRFAASLDVDFDRKVELYIELSKSATLTDIVYWLQLLFSAGIATLGLVLNSTAVIIGAMLISPLMGPILSAGLALATGDLILAFRSVANLFLSTFGGILFAVILVALLPFNDFTPEIAARVKPNTLDLVIALFSGAIGSIATCRQVKGVVTSIPGVAIAVALMPPLCVVGYGTGVAVSENFSEGMKIAAGGGLLYLTNLVAITFTSMLVFVMLRIDTVRVREKLQLWRETDKEYIFWLNVISKVPRLEQAREIRSFALRLLMVLLPLLIIFIPLSQSFSKMKEDIIAKQNQNKLETKAKEIWNDKIQQPEGKPIRSELDHLRINEEDGKLKVYIRVFEKIPYTQDDKDKYVTLLGRELKKRNDEIILQLVEIPLSEKDKKSPVILATPTPVSVAEMQARYLERIQSSLAGLKLPLPATLIDYDITIKSNNRSEVIINYLSNRDIEDDGKSMLGEDIRKRMNLQNFGLSYVRISSELQKIPFEKNSAELEDEVIELLKAIGQILQTHPKLRLRIMLKPDEKGSEILKKRKNKLKKIWMQNLSIPENKLAFSETQDDEIAETFQFFIK